MSVYYLAHGKLIPLTLSDLINLVDCLTNSQCPLFDLNCLEDEWFENYFEDPDMSLRDQAYLLENQRNASQIINNSTIEENVQPSSANIYSSTV